MFLLFLLEAVRVDLEVYRYSRLKYKNPNCYLIQNPSWKVLGFENLHPNATCYKSAAVATTEGASATRCLGNHSRAVAQLSAKSKIQ